MGYYGQHFGLGIPPGVPLSASFQTIKHLTCVIRVPIFVAVTGFYPVQINSLSII